MKNWPRLPNAPDADFERHMDVGKESLPEATADRKEPAPVGFVSPSASWREQGSQVTEANVPRR